jgi:flagellar protein FlaF
MASAEIIGAAIGILLMMIVAYLLVGSTLTAAEIVTTAQKDVTLQNEVRIHTAIEITHWKSPLTSTILFNVTNQGDEPISDFSDMDVYLWLTSTNPPTRYQFGDGTGGTWNITDIRISPTQPEIIHPGILNPGEYMAVKIELSAAPSGALPVKIVTNNGVATSKTIV